ncbi:macrolide family glycosyltransferase [Amycolatopsis sp. CA-230715]|uniref:macrolide family glycosyltransferase n=1 Tax=Amycolatopsis sp. CA-230715 TaxID=2745196 RepID=UPI001C0320B1|nr:macrolide family glycosyltransferase [Amycolatopsis sp. CA-230715]QWF80720.1 Demethyllactenocin mycarosyltransferase [Amycolatopsis sp. CA-230715]
MHVVCTTPPARGHVNPVLGLVEELVRRGHRVSFVTGPELAPVVARAGAVPVEVDWAPGAGANTAFSVDDVLADMRGFLAATRRALPGLLTRFRADEPAVVCADSVVLGPLLAGAFGVPLVSLVPTFATNEHFDVARLIPGFDPSHPGFAAYGAEVGALLAEHGGAEPVAKLVFVPREFQIDGDTFDESFHFIGPSRSHRSDEVWDGPGADVVLVSLGTAFTNRPGFFRAVIDAFAGTRWHVVMSVGPHVDLAGLPPVPSNVDISPFVPQPAVLRRARAFVTHAGMGSTMEALDHEVPVVAVPQAPEQRVNAARAAELGLGVVSDGTDPLADVERVARDDAVRARLARMKRALRAAGGAAAGADVIERAR